jgi:sarcosine oxidase subunit beta
MHGARANEIVVIGAGIVGISIAYHLAVRAPGARIVTLERESRPGLGATSKATGGIRHQFSTDINVRLSQLGHAEYSRFFETHGQNIGFRTQGYMFVTTSAEKWGGLRESAEMQRSLGVPTETLSPEDAGRLVPQLRTDDLVGATYCGIDASGNPSDALNGYLASARALGVELVTGAEVTGIDVAGGAVTGVRTTAGEYAADVVIDAAGARVRDIAALLGIEVPARPFQRQVFVMERVEGLPLGLPMIIDLDTGWYVHQEAGGRLIFGGTDKDSRQGIVPEVDWGGFEKVAQAALVRIPDVAERAEVVRAYAGIRTLTPDHHAILGDTAVRGFVLASSCNGHGFMHAPGVGQLIAEHVVDGRAKTVDISPLALERFATGKLVREAVTF